MEKKVVLHSHDSSRRGYETSPAGAPRHGLGVASVPAGPFTTHLKRARMPSERRKHE